MSEALGAGTVPADAHRPHLPGGRRRRGGGARHPGVRAGAPGGGELRRPGAALPGPAHARAVRPAGRAHARRPDAAYAANAILSVGRGPVTLLGHRPAIVADDDGAPAHPHPLAAGTSRSPARARSSSSTSPGRAATGSSSTRPASSCGRWAPVATRQLVRTGPKLVYCFRDLQRLRPSVALAAHPRVRRVQPGPQAPAVRLGTSVGWADVYPATYHENFVDVTGPARLLRPVADRRSRRTSSSRATRRTTRRAPWSGCAASASRSSAAAERRLCGYPYGGRRAAVVFSADDAHPHHEPRQLGAPDPDRALRTRCAARGPRGPRRGAGGPPAQRAEARPPVDPRSRRPARGVAPADGGDDGVVLRRREPGDAHRVLRPPGHRARAARAAPHRAGVAPRRDRARELGVRLDPGRRHARRAGRARRARDRVGRGVRRRPRGAGPRRAACGARPRAGPRRPRAAGDPVPHDGARPARGPRGARPGVHPSFPVTRSATTGSRCRRAGGPASTTRRSSTRRSGR